jgi:hypothetical protein
MRSSTMFVVYALHVLNRTCITPLLHGTLPALHFCEKLKNESLVTVIEEQCLNPRMWLSSL